VGGLGELIQGKEKNVKAPTNYRGGGKIEGIEDP